MTAFLGSLSQKASHSPRLQIGTNADLKPLTWLIGTEKQVLQATAKLSSETKRAGDAVRDWGVNEGDDLRDVLQKVSQLFDQLSRAQMVFTTHQETYRSYFKSIRTREEAFAQLRKSRDSLASKIESAERLLAKTSPEHKERDGRERRVAELQQEMVGMTNAVAKEDAELYDYKRETTRLALSLREMNEKGVVVAEMAKLLIAEIPRERTPINGPHPMYYGDQETDRVMKEAERCLSAVTFNPHADLMPASPPPPDRSGLDPNLSGRGSRTSMQAPPDSPSRTYAKKRVSVPSAQNAVPQLGTPGNVSEDRGDPYDAYFASSPVAGETFAPSPGLQRSTQAAPPVQMDGYNPSPLSQNLLSAEKGGRRSPLPVAPRSSLGYMAGDDDEQTAPAQPAAGPEEYSTPLAQPAQYMLDEARAGGGSGYATPPSNPSSSVGRSRPNGTAARHDPSSQYPHEDDAHWARNNASQPIPTPTAAPGAVAGMTSSASQPGQLPQSASQPAPLSGSTSQGQLAEAMRPKYARGDSALGSRHGFDHPVYGGPDTMRRDAPGATEQSSRYPAPIPASSNPQFSYHNAVPPLLPVPQAPPPQSRTMTAAAFNTSRNKQPQPISSSAPNALDRSGQPSPAAQIREAYLSSQRQSAAGNGPESPVVGDPTPPLRFSKRDQSPAPALGPQQPSIPIDGWDSSAPPAYGQPPASQQQPQPNQRSSLAASTSSRNMVPAAAPAKTEPPTMRYVTKLD